MSGEAASRAQISIPRAQQNLAEAVAATGKPVAVLLKHGRTLELAGAIKQARAIVCTWFLGSESGNAIADVVFGDFAPQGRLPVSFPQSSGQEPYYYDHRATGRPQTKDSQSFKARYREVTNEALFSFGHGLGYSTVDFGPTLVSASQLTGDAVLKITARLMNTGQRAQHEIAQLYIHDKVASLTQPVRALKGVQHIDLMPGESAVVEFVLSASDLKFVHPDFVSRAEAGGFDVWIAPSSSSGIPSTFVLT
jgi:beta-glucosidase